MRELFEVAIGSVTGRDHILVNKNNQDASCVRADKEKIVVVVCDGCSEGRHSEVGAKIGASLIAEEIKKVALNTGQLYSKNFWEEVRRNTLARIRCLAVDMGGSFLRVISDYFLFTVIGFVLTKENFFLFSIGDGFAQVNDESIMLGPFPGNEPPYLAYALLGSSLTKKDPMQLKFKLVKTTKQEQINSIIIGSDGIEYLIEARDKNIPGKNDLVGPIEQFFEDKYYKNKDMLRRRLAIINKDSVKYIRDVRESIVEVKKENGLLRDDTTIVALRRR